MDKYVAFANETWIDFISGLSKDNHVFIDDIKYIVDHDRAHGEYIVENPDARKIETPQVTATDCFQASAKVLKPKQLADLYQMLVLDDQPPLWSEIVKQIDQISHLRIYPTTSLDVEMSKTRNVINVLVLGAGPTGLFIANHLDNLANPAVNVIVVDSRVSDDKINRLPYSRNRLFSVNTDLFTPILRRIPGISDDRIRIKYLEYVLLALAYGNGIKVCYAKLDDLDTFVQAKKIDVVFDCTGGRFKQHYLNPDPPNPFTDKVMQWEDYTVVKRGNECILERKDGMANRFYLDISTYRYGHFIQSISDRGNVNIHSLDDLNALKKLHGTCFRLARDQVIPFVQAFAGLTDLTLSKTIQSEILTHKLDNFTFSIIEAWLHHHIEIAAIFQVQEHSCIYVAAGDTAFSSHFEIGSGLRRVLLFLNQLVWGLQMLYVPQKMKR